MFLVVVGWGTVGAVGSGGGVISDDSSRLNENS